MKLFIKVAIASAILLAPAIRTYAYLTMEYGTPKQAAAQKKLCYDLDWAMWNDWQDEDGAHHHEFIASGTMQVGKDCTGSNRTQEHLISNKRLGGDVILRTANTFYIQQVHDRAATDVMAQDEQWRKQLMSSNAADMIFFPNPGSGIVNVKGQIKSGEGWAISVQDIAGKSVFNYKIPNGFKTIDMAIDFSSLPKGIYQATLSSPSESLPVQRLVIQ